MPPSWFEKLTGFREQTPDQVRANLAVEGSAITSRVNGRSMEFGRLETPSLAELRLRAAGNRSTTATLTVEEVVEDVQTIHTRPEVAGALFQVASQFNLLEMVSPAVTPEHGISRYENDHTQGPACAIAAGAGTIYRNYFAPIDEQIGQSASRQIDCLADIASLLGNQGSRYWSMENGYALPTYGGLESLNRKLASMDENQLDEIRGALRIGLQWDTEVTLEDHGHKVTQAYCSALPVAYRSHPSELWEPFARLVLEATYEATLAAAVLNADSTRNRRVFLTLVGGGAFGNKVEWIISAIERALKLFERHALDVKIVSYGHPNRNLRDLTRKRSFTANPRARTQST